MQIKEFSLLTGVSVRTLHYYDEIGLLKPAEVDRNTGYRFYDEKSLLRMQEILFYRELDFSLKSIDKILSSPDYDREKALMHQKQLLILKKERLERIIDAIDSAGKEDIDMEIFDNSEIEKYKSEVKDKWGETEAYSEYTQKAKDYSAQKVRDLGEGMNSIMAEFAEHLKIGYEPCGNEVQLLVKKLQSYITENFYTCNCEILAGLGQMYVADERFRKNIDRYAEGNAAFIKEAIEIYCGK